jgi:hypothetical protein
MIEGASSTIDQPKNEYSCPYAAVAGSQQCGTSDKAAQSICGDLK